MTAIKVLIAGRSAAQCEIIRQLLDHQADIKLSVLVLESGNVDPLAALTALPDVVIASLDIDGHEVLRAIGSHRGRRPALIAIGPAADSAMMRLAMQVGARDYFAVPIHLDDLLQSVRSIQAEVGSAGATSGSRGKLIAVINAKGGSGASTVAANFAHIAARLPSPREVALVDLDVQFGALPLMFDLREHGGLLGAIEGADQITPGSIAKYGSRHVGGVTIFSAMSEQIPLPWELSVQGLDHFLATARQAYRVVVVDLPRQIDPLTSVVLTQADHVLVVMQQSLVHVRDAKRMLRILTATLAVPRDNISVVVNRHVERGALSDRDISEAVNPPQMVSLPNDYRAVLDAQNLGVPLYEQHRESSLVKALIRLQEQILRTGTTEVVDDKRAGGLRAALKKALGGR